MSTHIQYTAVVLVIDVGITIKRLYQHLLHIKHLFIGKPVSQKGAHAHVRNFFNLRHIMPKIIALVRVCFFMQKRIEYGTCSLVLRPLFAESL